MAVADAPNGRSDGGDAALLVVVLAGLELDVVAEPLRLLVRIRMAADVDQQGGVVDRSPRLIIQAHPLREPQRDEALPQHMLHRLAEAQVDAERQGRHEVSQSHVGAAWRDRTMAIGRSMQHSA